MDFRRGGCGVRLDAVHKSGAHKPAGRSRFSGHEHAAVKNRGDVARGVLRLSFHQTKWPWYSHVAPVSWLVASDVKTGRQHLNFSNWPVDDPDRATNRLENISEQLGDKEMPPAEYTLIHANARLTAAEREQLIQWVGQEAARLKSPAKGK